MRWTTLPSAPTSAEVPTLFVPVFEDELAANKRSPLGELDKALGGVLMKMANDEGFKGKSEQTFVLHSHGKVRADRVVLLGMGSRKSFRLETLRLAAGRAAKVATRLRSARAAFIVASDKKGPDQVRAVVEGFELGVYKFDRYRTTNKDEKAAQKLEEVVLLVDASDIPQPKGRAGFTRSVPE